MADDENSDAPSGKGSRFLMMLAVTLGIALFIAGFVMTVVSLSDDSSARTDSTDQSGADAFLSSAHSGMLVLGLVLSMGGVVLATAVPAACFIRGEKCRA